MFLFIIIGLTSEVTKYAISVLEDPQIIHLKLSSSDMRMFILFVYKKIKYGRFLTVLQFVE